MCAELPHIPQISKELAHHLQQNKQSNVETSSFSGIPAVRDGRSLTLLVEFTKYDLSCGVQILGDVIVLSVHGREWGPDNIVTPGV